MKESLSIFQGENLDLGFKSKCLITSRRGEKKSVLKSGRVRSRLLCKCSATPSGSPLYLYLSTPPQTCAPPSGLGSFQDKYLHAGLAKHTLFTLSLGNQRGGPQLMDPVLGYDGEFFILAHAYAHSQTHIIAFSRPCYQAS